MKTAVYMEDGLTQIVLTPQTEWEKLALKGLKGGVIETYRGSFYECQGGWTRSGMTDESLILRIPKS